MNTLTNTNNNTNANPYSINNKKSSKKEKNEQIYICYLHHLKFFRSLDCKAEYALFQVGLTGNSGGHNIL